MEDMDNTRKKNLVIILMIIILMLLTGHFIYNSGRNDYKAPIVIKKDSVQSNLNYDTTKIVKAVHRGIVTSFKSDSSVALTFDACETKTPSFFDTSILNYLIKNEIPFTLFVNGKFAIRNMKKLKEISILPFVEIENHTFNHVQNMEKLTKDSIIQEVILLEKLLRDSIGYKPAYFRFPGGNYDDIALNEVEKLGYTVVHWTFPSGDPDKNLTPKRLASGVISQAKPGNILIFHMNGRGWSTGKALPEIINAFRKKRLSFSKLNKVI